MRINKRTSMPYKRKRQGKTNYKKRLKLLMARKPRLCVRISLNSVKAQIIEYAPDGDKIICAADSRIIQKLGSKLSPSNTSTAYLVGLMAAKLAQKKGVKELILDIGFKKPIKGSKVYAVLKGAVDAGIKIPHSEEVLPTEDRINGKHIKNLPENHVNEIKNKILGAKDEKE